MKKIISLALAVILMMSFAGCDKNLKIEKDENNRDETSFDVGGFALSIDEEENVVEIGMYTGDDEKVRVPDTVDGLPVVGILANCFAGCDVEEVKMGKYVYYIESYAFQWTAIEEFEVPEGATYLGDHVFLECENLKNVTLPDSLETIGDNIFEGCVSEVEVVVEKDSFAHEYCEKILADGANIKIKAK